MHVRGICPTATKKQARAYPPATFSHPAAAEEAATIGLEYVKVSAAAECVAKYTVSVSFLFRSPLCHRQKTPTPDRHLSARSVFHRRLKAYQLFGVDLGGLWHHRAQGAHRPVLSRDPHGEALPPGAVAVGQRDRGRRRVGPIGDRENLSARTCVCFLVRMPATAAAAMTGRMKT